MKKSLLMFLFIFLFLLAGCTNKKQEDAVDLNVNSYVASFEETKIVNYIAYEDGLLIADVYVMGALCKAKQVGDFDSSAITMDKIALSAHLNTLENTPNNLFKKALLNNLFLLSQEEVLASVSALEFSSFTNVYDMLSVLSALNILNIEIDLRTQLEEHVYDIGNNEYADSDYMAQVIIALAGRGYDLTAFKSFITDNLSEEGIETWGNSNAASTSMAIMAFLAMGENPREIEGRDLIEILFTYKDTDGFKWLKTDDAADFAFSTPQAFASLAIYKVFKDNKTPVIIFS